MKILAIDDDPQILSALEVGIPLQWQNAVILTATDAEVGLAAFRAQDPDVVLLDISMPRQDGLEVLRAIRRSSDVPVLLLSARAGEIDQVRGLELGADGYVVKPFGFLALLARIKAVLRRAELPPPTEPIPDLEVRDLAITYADRRVTLRGETVRLSRVEYDLLEYLARNAGQLLAHRQLLDRVWGASDGATTDYLKVYISRLRAKIEPPDGPHLVETVRGIGYRLARPLATAASGH